MPNAGRALLVWFTQQATRAARQFGRDGGHTILVCPRGTWPTLAPRLAEAALDHYPEMMLGQAERVRDGVVILYRAVDGLHAMPDQLILVDEDVSAAYVPGIYRRVVAAGHAWNMRHDMVARTLAEGGEAQVMTLLDEDETGS